MRPIITYIRVSTGKQGRSGLGIDAQREAIARFADISLAFDPTFRDMPVTVDLRNATLEDALNAASASTRTFFRVTAPRTVTVIPDTAAKRREYEEEIVRTFYLSNADLKEAMDLLRLVIDSQG